jgi:hypothetical protein
MKIIFGFIFLIFCHFLILATNDIEISFTINNNIFEFDSLYIITRINWTKTDTNDYNYLLGIFEGFNDPNFCDSMPIAMIKEENIKESDLNINVTSNIPYKYIRYIFPNNKSSSITPIKIYGYKYIKSNEASQNLFFKPTNLPLIIINTENSIEPTTKDVYINSNIIIVNENNIQINETARIKVRGHSTSSYVKKPFKIKFDKKQKILAFSGKYKNWVLLANYLDKAVLRTSFAFYISRIIGLEYTPRCESVDVILNGNFRGNYMICDQIEVKEGRVEIEEMTPDDITEPNITGRYLLEIDYRAPESGDKYLITNKGLRLGIKYPDSDDITIEQENYIKKYLNDLEERIYNYNLSYIDENSFYKYFLMQEFCADIDTVFSSFHIYKRRNDIKLHFGPV